MRSRTLFAALAALALLRSVFPASTAANPAQEIRPLRISWWGSQTRHDRTLRVLDLFAAKCGVKFEPEFYNFDDYFTKLNALIAAADAPDIMQLGGNFRNYMDYIETLNPYISKGLIDTTGTDPAFIAITTLDGRTVGISNGTNAQAIAYDPALFTKAGVPLPTNRWTWDDFEKASLQIHQKLGILGSSKLDEWTVLSASWVTQYNRKLQTFFKEPYREALNYTDDGLVASFFSLKKRLTDAGAYPSPAQMAEIKNIEGDPIVRGDAAMTWIASNQFVAISTAAERPLALVMPPRRTANGPLAQTIMSSQMMSIYKGSRQKDLAAAFISYWVNDVEANIVLGGERGVPIVKEVRDAVAKTLPPQYKVQYDYLTVLGKEAALNIVLDSAAANDIKEVYIKLSEQVIFNQLTPAAAAAELRKQAETILARLKKQRGQ